MDTEGVDYPASTSTPGLISGGSTDYGVIATSGDVDWFRVALVAGQSYRFKIEAGTMNGLFDPQLSLYDSAGSLIERATIGEGFQLKYLDYVAGGGGNHFLAASGTDSLTGTYRITVTGTTGDGSDGGGSGSGGSGVESDKTYVLQPGDGNTLTLTGSKSIRGTGNDEDNTILGNTGNNKLYGLAGNDVLDGDAGNDQLEGADGSDVLMGGAGNDKLYGGVGDDRFVGAAGVDQITGGSGADTFVFNHVAKGNADKIKDFNLGEGDLFAFDSTIFTALGEAIGAGNVVIAAKAQAQDADDFLLFSTKGGKLYYDADGNGAGAAIQLAAVKGSLTGLDYTSFVIDGV